jgi:hypothetical protein
MLVRSNFRKDRLHRVTAIWDDSDSVDNQHSSIDILSKADPIGQVDEYGYPDESPIKFAITVPESRSTVNIDLKLRSLSARK